ncbi:TAXI family TRAP transporter solute-binding subunit [Eggerthellaceae bacterium zg-893]|nr:TAXI family TRAP transporter solute-binding subunit [Eggerthellaceae bacterium zg-893]
MKKKIKAFAAVALAGVLALGIAGCSGGGDAAAGGDGGAAPAADGGSLRFMTGGESGTYYAYGNVLAQYATNGDYGLDVTALAGNGSQANIEALQDGDSDIAFCQSDVLAYAYDGTNLFEGAPYEDFSVVADLYQEQVQIVTCDPSIKSVEDLKGKTVSVGAANSGVYFNAVDILGVYGIELSAEGSADFEPVYQSFADSADSLKDGKIDAAFIVAGAPTTAITDLSTTKDTYLVSLDQAHIDELLASNPYYSEATIPAETYGTEGPVETVSVGAVIIANNSVSEDSIYNLTKSIFDGQQDNADAHAKYNELVLEDAAAITSVPYHPGAAKYYEEQGVTAGE